MTENPKLVLALGQMTVEAGRPEANLARAERMIRDAGGQGAAMIVLPECLDLGWTDPSALDSAAPIPGPRSERLAAAAREAGVYVAAGLTEQRGDRRHNAALLLDPDGRILLHHRKINLLDIERPSYFPGDRLGVAETPWGRVGLNICADNFMDSLWIGDALGRLGARLLVSPCAWALDADQNDPAIPYSHWEPPYAELARRHAMAVVGVSNVGWIRGGPWKGKKCVGSSLAVGADAKTIRQAEFGDAAETLDLISI